MNRSKSKIRPATQETYGSRVRLHIVTKIERKLPPKKAQKMQVLMLGALQRFLAPDRLQIRMLANSPKGNTYPLGDDVAGSMMGLR